MDDNMHRSRPQPASLDGIVPRGHSYAMPARQIYPPGRTQPSPTLDNLIRQPKNKNHSTVSYATELSVSPELAEAEKLLDKPIILDNELESAKKQQRHRHPKARKALKGALLSVIVIIASLGGLLGWKLQHSASKVFHGNLLGILHTTKLRGEDQGRVNILIAGNSADDPGHDGANLTDSIMLVSLDTVHNNGYMLSIPRDLWVDFGTNNCSVGNRGKINAVYECGMETKFNESGFPTGGMGLLEKVVQQDFGVNINYYALIDYSALRDAVNDVSGIEFAVNSSDPRGLYDPSIDYATHGPLVKLTNGSHLLSGQQALDLARARGDAYGSYGFPKADFNRTQNQRQMMLALKAKALSAGVLSNPAKLGGLMDAVGNNVQTDFQTSEVRRLYDLSKIIPNNAIQSAGLTDNTPNLLASTNFNGQSSLIPSAGQEDFGQIQAFIKRLNSSDPVAKENANVEILNGTKVGGLAAKNASTLTAKGINVLGVGDATTHPSTLIVELNSAKTATKNYLEQVFKTNSTADASVYPAAKNYNADFVIILGDNVATVAQN